MVASREKSDLSKIYLIKKTAILGWILPMDGSKLFERINFSDFLVINISPICKYLVCLFEIRLNTVIFDYFKSENGLFVLNYKK